VGSISDVRKVGESVVLKIAFLEQWDKLVIEKGSIAVNGVSLTVNETGNGWCSVNLIPHTLANTNLSELRKNSKVNVEFDLIGKYVIKSETGQSTRQITFEKLKESGW
ncbi:MAG TPA: riboflavin synthase, partial [candidate division Zixibacteria bacterium]|nr:riboflavin synthase [candidate division Zixibacteria bacterium]